MNTINFVQEFTQLITRWTRPVTTNEEGGDNPIAPLSNQQLVNAIQDVLQATIGVSLQMPDYSSATTPAVGIAVCTPNAPMVPKNSSEQCCGNLGRYKSLDSLIALSHLSTVNGNVDPLSSKSQEKLEPMDVDMAVAGSEEKKFITRSSPSIRSDSVYRSDTFVREQEKKAALEKEQVEDDVFAKLEATISEEKLNSHSILQKMKMLREYAFTFISKIEDMEKDIVRPEATKPIRRLSTIGVFSGKSSSVMRPTSTSKHRRSSRAFPGTPTSSKLSLPLADKEDNASRRKSIATFPIYSKPASTDPKKSPVSSGGKGLKNSKYAHVQSTIPKPAVLKRKAP